MKRLWLVVAGLVLIGSVIVARKTAFTESRSDAQPHVIPFPRLGVQTCAEALAYPTVVDEDDVRFLECDRQGVPDAEAFKLEPPIIERDYPAAQDATQYKPGSCEHHAGSITTLSVRYNPQDLDVAINCSARRCDAGDADGCEDLGRLHSDDDYGGKFHTRRPDARAALAAFDRGCTLGSADACLSLAADFDRQGDQEKSARYFKRACEAPVPLPRACLETAQRLIAVNKEEDAVPYLLRACRGTALSDNVMFSGSRQGCYLLARRAKARGDRASYEEYLRLECAFGGGESTLAACEELGLLVRGRGELKKAVAYLHKACGSPPMTDPLYERSCKALREIGSTQ
jgi:TPR repeat protein